MTANTFSDSVSVLLNTTGAAAVQTATVLSASAVTAVFGQPVTLTAIVVSLTGDPTGTVTFRDGTTVLGTVALDTFAGLADLTVSLGVVLLLFLIGLELEFSRLLALRRAIFGLGAKFPQLVTHALGV